MTYTAAALNTRVQLQSEVTIENDFGEIVGVDWVTYAEAFALVEPLVGREYIASGADATETNLKVTIRYRPDVSRKHRVVVRGEGFDIIDAQDIKFRRRELLLYCKRIA